jgi:hypothetical protein
VVITDAVITVTDGVVTDMIPFDAVMMNAVMPLSSIVWFIAGAIITDGVVADEVLTCVETLSREDWHSLAGNRNLRWQNLV